jgi:hypothetical protein
MACETRTRSNQTLVERGEQVKKALSRLEKALATGKAKVKVGKNGAIAFEGWKPEERDDITDVCALRILQAQNSWELRKAIATAEQQAGVKVNKSAVNAGIHSHDGGLTWNKGH